MPDDDLRAEIADLEDRIEHLAVSLHRSRKMLVAAKAALWLGAAWIAATLLHLAVRSPAGPDRDDGRDRRHCPARIHDDERATDRRRNPRT
jgi:hypothetical protein